ncbi:large ribosomal subunit protein mL43 [Procambarus clarkii]|uniref:large ribosomal subunit protein mL43 n=1 Tax=Procambarus clarkii TaxID=6728 RepID=UPI001E678E22|nr:39S ribosomal protein L43, mitochondrial-like isoform X1 [Procambarus clarkii]XP_045594417.1 39S ribosomal protein L43, mitochondrial-like isoform X2 [Procambarus clarkii]
MTSRTWNSFWGSTFVKAPLRNGVGRYVQQLQRITFKFCKSSGSSQGTREYIEKELIEFARENPGVVVYLKPRRHRSSCLKAEYLNGGEEYISTHKQTYEEIKKWVEYLRTRSGYPVELLRKYQHTDHPSIQGAWTPWIHRDPIINIAEYPNEELSAAIKTEKTGTDQILELVERQKISGRANTSS